MGGCLVRFLNDFIFHKVSLSEIVEDYKNSGDHKNDNSGKKLYSRIDSELRNRNKSRDEFVGLIVDYLMENDSERIKKIVTFLKDQLKVPVT